MKLLWKNGPVSAASISGGVLNVPLPNESSTPSLSASKFGCVTALAAEAAVEERDAVERGREVGGGASGG